MVRFILSLLAIAATLIPATAAETSAETSPPASVRGYKLASGDRITVTVHGQPELSGDFLIDGSGEIHVPLLDAVKVDQSTIDEARQKLMERLATGLLKKPSVSIRVSEFRPIYVLGDVRAPGSYRFHFGLSGLSAVALAGGIGRPDLNPGGAVAELVNAEERVAVLKRNRLGLLVRRARLEAERKGQETFDFSETSNSFSDENTSALVNEEREQMRVVLQAHARTIALLDRQRPQVQSEIETTKEQIKVETNQLALIRSSLKSVQYPR